MIAFAKRHMIPELKEMWRSCFGDEEAYIDFYFERRFKEDNMLVYLDEKEKPVSMLSLLPAGLVQKGNEVKRVHYIYAGATFPEQRRKGYYKALLMHAALEAEGAGESLMLVPADEKLREYYRKQGFVDAFQLTSSSIKIQRPGLISMESHTDDFTKALITAEEYKELRDKHFYKEGYVCWDIEAVRYAVDETLFCKGECSKLIYKGMEYGVLYYIDNADKLCIKEITASGNEAVMLIRKLAELLGLKAADYVLEADAEGGDCINYAMTYKDSGIFRAGYFNLSLG